jgi:hypothetical protein
MLFALAEVAQQGFAGGLADRDDPAASAFATEDGDETADQVDVVELQTGDLAGADGGLENEPDDRLVTAVVERLLR